MRWRRFGVALAVLALASLFGLSQAFADDDESPTASFTFSPGSPLTNETVTFTSTSVANEGRITSETWDLDNDGAFDDASGRTASRSFATPGTYTVRLRVRNSENRTDTESRSVTVRNRAPTASFTFSPSAPLSGQAIEFDASGSSDPDGTIASVGWDLNNNGIYGDASGTKISHSFATPGTYTVGLRVTDNSGASATTTRTVTVGNRAPAASFGQSPAAPLTGEPVTFTSSSSDPDGSIASASWDLDNDGQYDDATGASTSRSFARPGTYTVGLRVVDNLGAASTTSRTVTAGNRAPTAALSQSPGTPVVGEAVTFTSASSDPDGTIAGTAWDLDNDGQYDDAVGESASRSFDTPGSYTVGVRVTDDLGASAAGARTVEVAAAPPPPGGSAVEQEPFDDTGGPAPDPVPLPPHTDPGTTPALQWLQPFPVVRIRGRTTGRGARVTLLSVAAPAGSDIVARCKGRGCPVRRTGAKVSARGRLVRLRAFERHLRAGIRIEIFVTKPSMIGKYTRFKINRLKPPRRVDSCVMPGSRRPSRCPS